MFKKNYHYIKTFISESNLIEREDATLDEGSKIALQYLLEQDILTPDVIQKAHGYLMKDKSLEAKYKGKFRDCTVWIGKEKRDNQAIIHEQVTGWCSSDKKEYYAHNNKVIAMSNFLDLHFLFEKIHPFADGNGRLGRLLFLLRILQFDLHKIYFPNSKKHNYYNEFNNPSGWVLNYLALYLTKNS